MLVTAIFSHMTTALHISGEIPKWTVADRVRKARLYAGMSQAALAEEAGLARSGVALIEGGGSSPRRATLRVIAMATGVDSTWLETGKTPAGEPGGGSECAIRESNPEPTGSGRVIPLPGPSSRGGGRGPGLAA